MKYRHERTRPVALREPVQVYLAPADRDRLNRLTKRLDATKSDVLRRGLEALDALTNRRQRTATEVVDLPSFTGNGVLPGVDLDDSASLLDLMDRDTPSATD